MQVPRRFAAVVVTAATTALVITASGASLAVAETQPDFLGATLWAGGAHHSERPVAVAYAPGGKDVYELFRSAKGVRVARAHQDRLRGALTPVVGPGACLAGPATAGCGALPMPPNDAADLVVDPSGLAVRIVGDGVLTLRRDPATGALSALHAGRGCLPPATSAACGAAGDAMHLEVPAGDHAFALSGRSLLVLSVDPADGALSRVTGPGGCLAPADVIGCTTARGSGWTDALAADPTGRDVYAAGSTTGTLTLLHANLGADGVLRQPAGADGLPLEQRRACTAETASPQQFSTCTPVQLLLPEDGRDLYLTSPNTRDEQPATEHGAAFRRDTADGHLVAQACPTQRACPILQAPATVGPEGRQVYATHEEVVSEAPRAGQFIDTYARDRDTGRLTAKHIRPGVLQIADSDFRAVQLVASPTGRWLLANSLDILFRRTLAPPVITFRGLPRSCARRPVRVTVYVSGNRDPRRSVNVAAYEDFGLDQSADYASASRRAATITLVIPRVKATYLTIAVAAPGRDGNDEFTDRRRVHFC